MRVRSGTNLSQIWPWDPPLGGHLVQFGRFGGGETPTIGNFPQPYRKLANSEDNDKQTPLPTSYLGRTYLSKVIVCSFITSPDADLACKRKGGASVVSLPGPVETVAIYTRKSVVLRNPK
eukprot:1183453-Prorocentrum_minimum.AAC.1